MTATPRILVVDDETSMREMVAILLRRHGYEVFSADSGRRVVEMLDHGEQFDLVITDLVMDRGGGIDVLSEVKKRGLGSEVIVFTAFGSAETAVEAMKMGAYDYISKPFNVDEFMLIIRQALAHQELVRENIKLKARVRQQYQFADIVGRSSAMGELIDLCRKVSDSMATVLISGESGTGKEVVARSIHFSGPRSEKPFIAVNCGALPEQLMESEMFGYVKGAFTGAIQDKKGLLTSASGGTVFLDEVGELPMQLQVKLLRVLQDRMVRPVGSSKEHPIDIRIIAATNRDLGEQVAEGSFRKDLFYRLNVIHIRVPALKRRKEDIPLLVEHLLGRLASELGTPARRVSQEAMRLLVQYDYPGNVRELANIMERAATLATSEQIEMEDLPGEVRNAVISADTGSVVLPDGGIKLEEALESLERSLIHQALERANGVRTRAAAILGISFRSLRYRLNKLGISHE